ncbi:YfgJ family double zinc ribbon protein [Teredinibacter franksiae]|uniref:YfgJ family double zinc ribbon protein n=1 Tax=Teredinibacter franksiae TaxID=2761453 RepID=UPI001628C729
MSYFINCPRCNKIALNPLQQESQCEECTTAYTVAAQCPTCEAELERIIGCGTTTFFCNDCKAMVSKREAVYRLSSH